MTEATKAGTVAGSINRDGFCEIEIDGQTCRSDHLAWLYMTGAWPDGEIEHIDGDPLNDRWSNLRLKTPAQA
jgi:hypothetical protein